MVIKRPMPTWQTILHNVKFKIWLIGLSESIHQKQRQTYKLFSTPTPIN